MDKKTRLCILSLVCAAFLVSISAAQSLNSVPTPAPAPAATLADTPAAAPAAPAPAPAAAETPALDLNNVKVEELDDEDPYLVAINDRKKASIPLAFGVYGQLGVSVYSKGISMGSGDDSGDGTAIVAKDGKTYYYKDGFNAPIEIEIIGYWDVLELGLHRNIAGNYLSLNNRILVSRDWTFGYELEGGFSHGGEIMGGLGAVFEDVGPRWLGGGRITFGGGGSGIYMLLDGGIGYRLGLPFQKTPLTIGIKGFFDIVPSTRTWKNDQKSEVDDAPDFRKETEPGLGHWAPPNPEGVMAFGVTLFVRYAFNLQIK